MTPVMEIAAAFVLMAICRFGWGDGWEFIALLIACVLLIGDGTYRLLH